MKKWICTIIVASFLLAASEDGIWAQTVTMAEARRVAENWIRTIIHESGNWGTAQEAQIDDIQEFKSKGRPVGYLCRVQPKGFIIVSPRKEMVPVKAYSTKSELDSGSEEGLAEFLRRKMGHIFDKVQRIASERKSVTGQEVADTLDIDYRPAWDTLMSNPEGFMRKPQKGRGLSADSEQTLVAADPAASGEESNYQAGEVLLSSNYQGGDPTLLTSDWGLGPPYNNFCDDLGCAQYDNGRAPVGCVAVAAAQIMYYWGWPPWGVGSDVDPVVDYEDTYNWPNMRDTVTTNSPTVQQNAVAELCYEIGRAANMNYTCEGSGTDSWDMESAYEDHFRFADVQVYERDDYSQSVWFDIMKSEFNYNRPIQYRVQYTDQNNKLHHHHIVADGWKETLVGAIVLQWYHMNWGGAGLDKDTWYPLDSISDDPVSQERMILNIRPEPYLISLTGTFTRQAFPYRYFYRDTTGGTGTFEGGQRLQFLPRIVVKCTSGAVTFEGSASEYSHLFSRGNLSTGLKIHKQADAAVKLYPNGSIRFN